MQHLSTLPDPDSDTARLMRHHAYLAFVGMVDPLRAQVLSDLLAATYRYASIRAGDDLIALDQALYAGYFPTA